jgi:uncharacterized protein
MADDVKGPGFDATPDPQTGGPSRTQGEAAYVLPMALFLVLVWVGSRGELTPAGHAWYPWAYVARTFAVAALLWFFRRSYAPIRWNHWWLGLIVGVAGVVQWVGMQLALEQRFEFFKPAGTAFNPELFFADPAARWSFIAVRLLGAAVVVPFMEELFWRDYGWRVVIAGSGFRQVAVGTWDRRALLVIPTLFCLVHGNWWLTAIVWAFMIGGLLAYTRSLGACIVAHAVTNLLLGLYVLGTKQWFFW